jgi:hypothetical protein
MSASNRLTNLYRDGLNCVTNFLGNREHATLARTNRRGRAHIERYRQTMMPDVTISLDHINDLEKRAEQIYAAFRLMYIHGSAARPRVLRSLDLTTKGIYARELQFIADKIKGIGFTRFVFDGWAVTEPIFAPYGEAEIRAARALVENINFSRIEHLGIARLLYFHIQEALIRRLPTCTALQSIRTSFSDFNDFYYGKMVGLLNAFLGSSLRNTSRGLNFSAYAPIRVNNEIADLLMQFDPSLIEDIHLSFKEGDISPEKLRELLTFLKWGQMVRIELSGSALTPEIIEFIAEKLSTNRDRLVTCVFWSIGVDPDDFLGIISRNSLLVLMRSLNSPNLRDIRLYPAVFEYTDGVDLYFQTEEQINLLREKLSLWKNIDHFNVGPCNIDKIRSFLAQHPPAAAIIAEQDAEYEEALAHDQAAAAPAAAASPTPEERRALRAAAAEARLANQKDS